MHKTLPKFKVIFLFLFVFFTCSISFGASIKSTSSGGNWSATGSWVGGIVPTATDDIEIVSGATITVNGSFSANSLDIKGILLFTTNSTNITLPANGTIHIVSPGKVDNSGACSSNRSIIVGATEYASCNGGGASNSFVTLNNSGGNCLTYSLTSIAAVATACTTTKTSQVTLTGLPQGTYTVTYSLSYNGNSTSYTAPMTVNASGTGVFTASLSIMGADHSTTIRVNNIASGACNNAINSNNVSNTVNQYQPVNPNITGVGVLYPVCSTSRLQWTPISYSTGYFLDVSADSFTTYVYQDLNVGNVQYYDIVGLTPGTAYSYRIRSNNLGCGVSGNSNVVSMTTGGIAMPGAISGNASQCSSVTNQVYSVNRVSGDAGGYNWTVPSGWTITGSSQSATVNSITVTTGATGGNITVVSNNGSGCISGTRTLTVTMASTIGIASSTPALCLGSPIPTITHATTGYIGIGTPTNLPPGVTASFGSNMITIVGTPTTSVGSPFNYTIPLTGGTCGGGNATGTITVNASPTGLSYTTASPVYCLGTVITANTVTLTRTGTPAPTFSVSPALPAGLSLSTSTGAITGTPSVAVVATNYTITATNSCGTTQVTLNITVNASPTGLSYTTASPVYCLGTVITANTVTLTRTGTPAPTFSVSPALPAGLSLSTSTGAITGTPSVAVVATNYTITATNSCGTTQVTLNITVNASPIGLSYTTASPVYCLGTVITANTVTLTRTGTPVPTFSVSPALPAGLSLSTSTGAITGTPSVAVAATNYTVTATNSCGTAQTTLNITVNASPTGLSYTTASPVYCLGTAITSNTVTLTRTGTPAPTFSVSPALPAGLSMDTSTGAITGTPSVAVVATNYTITATNSCGTTQVTLNITVNASPTGLSYTTASPVYCLGTVITTNSVTLTRTGTPTPIFSVSPALPVGLSLSTSTGAITGTPTVAVAATNYTVTATNSCGIAQATLNITVNSTPTLSTATQTIFACSQGSGSPATIKLTGLINGPFTVNYTIGGVAQPQVTGLTAVSGEASFSTQNLVIGDNNKLLQITGINTITCSKSFAGVSGIDLNLDVRPNSGDITLSPGSTVASGGLISTSELTNITFSITAIPGATGYTWVFPGNPGDWIVQGASGNNSITVKTGTRFQGGPVTVTANNFCGSTINVILTGIAPSAPIQNGVTAATCKDLGSITLGNLPVGSWSLTIKKVGESEVYDPTPRTGSTFPISGLAVGSYIFKVTDVYGTSIESNPIVVAGPLTKKWDGSSWLNNVTSAITITPTIEENAVFAGDYNSSGPIQSCSCQINSGATVTIKSGDVLVIENGLNVDPAGSLIFDSGASLVQNNPSKTINSGSITYKRNSSALKNLDYVYWSSPLESQALSGVFSGSNKMWFYDLGLWVPAVGTMVPAKGYIVRYSSAPSQNAVFVGKPNNGDYSIAALATGNYLIGNPYPSAIDADKFMEDNIAIIGGGILNFWAHNTERAESTDGTKYIYSASDYASYSQLGGTSATTGGFEPDGTIAAGQSFFVSNATGGGDLIFTNSMRISGLGKNSQFFKQATTKKGSKIEKSRLWLNLTNEKGLFKQLLVGYATGATNTHDNLFDGKTLNGNAFADFYSIEGSTNYTIQARSLPFTAEDEVPLGFKTTIAGTFQIKINKADGSLLHQAIYLEDKTTNTVHDLKNGSYSFTAEIGTFNDRFVLRYNNNSKLGTDDNTIKGKGVIVSVKNRQIKINSFDQNLSSLKLYDLKGSLLYERNKLNNNEFIIDNLATGTQFMIVMVQMEDGKWVTEEIIFHD